MFSLGISSAAAEGATRTRASAVVWKIYIEFEMRVGDLQSAKKILYRAIGECPFFKGNWFIRVIKNTADIQRSDYNQICTCWRSGD